MPSRRLVTLPCCLSPRNRPGGFVEIILRETIDNLGRAGQVVKVANGYARNYLLPRKLAYPATAGNLKVIESERQSLLRKEAKQKEEFEKQMQMLEKVEITIRRKVGEQ